MMVHTKTPRVPPFLAGFAWGYGFVSFSAPEDTKWSSSGIVIPESPFFIDKKMRMEIIQKVGSEKGQYMSL